MPWLTDNVFKQAPEESLLKLPSFGDGPRRIRFRHIVHAYRDHAVPANTAVQSITFETLRKAAQFAGPHLPVTCIAVTYPEDLDLIPPGVVIAPLLDRVVTDIAPFGVARPLPLFFDILHHATGFATAAEHRPDEVEYIVFTNSDIHVQPGFYQIMAELIAEGYDVVTANRRTLDADWNGRGFSPLLMAERGTDHPGLDCFVFPASMLPSFAPSDCCCGAGHVMRSLLFNLVAHARRFAMLTQAQMTYHLGDDRHWAQPAFDDYVAFNKAAAIEVIEALARDGDKAKRLAAFIAAHETDPEYHGLIEV